MGHIVILGSSGHARVVIDLLKRSGEHRIAGIVSPDRAPGENVFGHRVLGDDKELPQLLADHRIDGCIVAVGDNWRRHLIATKVKEYVPHLPFISAVHPEASIGRDVVIGAGTVVMAGAVVNAGSQVGKHCIVNTSASIDHECSLQKFVSIAPGATLGGNVRVGEFSVISLGGNVVHEVTVGRHTVVGAGAVVTQDLPGGIVAYGVPARPIRTREPDEPYL